MPYATSVNDARHDVMHMIADKTASVLDLEDTVGATRGSWLYSVYAMVCGNPAYWQLQPSTAGVAT